MGTQALPRPGAACPPVTSHISPIEYSNSQEGDVRSSLNHVCALEGCAPSHTQGCVQTQPVLMCSPSPAGAHPGTSDPRRGPACALQGPGAASRACSRGALSQQRGHPGGRQGRAETRAGVEGLAPPCPGRVADLPGRPGTAIC